MFVLYETPAGYAIFKVSFCEKSINSVQKEVFLRTKDWFCGYVNSRGAGSCTCGWWILNGKNVVNFEYFVFEFQLLDENKLTKVDNLYHEFETPEKANKM